MEVAREDLVRVARPAPAALGEEDDGEPSSLRQPGHPVLLLVVLLALRAGQHRVVVRHHHAARGSVREQMPVHAAGTHDQPVGRRRVDQLLDRVPLTARRDHERPVLDERALVAECGDVLAHRSLAGPPAPRQRAGPGGVPGLGLSRDHLGQVGPEDVLVDLFVRVLGCALEHHLLDEDSRPRHPTCWSGLTATPVRRCLAYAGPMHFDLDMVSHQRSRAFHVGYAPYVLP